MDDRGRFRGWKTPAIRLATTISNIQNGYEDSEWNYLLRIDGARHDTPNCIDNEFRGSPFDVKLNDLSRYEFSGSSGSAGLVLLSPGGGTSKNAPDLLWLKCIFLEDDFRLNTAPSETHESGRDIFKRSFTCHTNRTRRVTYYTGIYRRARRPRINKIESYSRRRTDGRASCQLTEGHSSDASIFKNRDPLTVPAAKSAVGVAVFV